MRRIDAHLDGVRWAGELRGRPARAPGSTTIEAWTDVFATWRDELERKVAAGQHDLAGELSEGALLLEQRGRAREDAEDRGLIEHAPADARGRDRARERQARRRARTRAARGDRARRRAPRRRDAATEPLAIEVDRERARFGAWYELFPRSWGGLKGVEQQLPRAGRARLRRALPAADPPDRPDQPQGPQQRARRRARRPRHPVGDRRRRPAATTPSTPSSGTIDDLRA